MVLARTAAAADDEEYLEVEGEVELEGVAGN